MGNADVFSRLPLRAETSEDPRLAGILLVESAPEIPVDAKQIERLTRSVLSRMLRWALRGWPEKKPSQEFLPFYSRRAELSVYRGCLLWGSRVIIPPTLRPGILDLLHSAHPGVVRMKGHARSYVWWPGLDSDIERKVLVCATCYQTRNAPPRAPVHAWEFSTKPWSRIHVDFAGPFMGRFFLLIIDSFSK